MKKLNNLLIYVKRHYKTLIPFLTLTKAINIMLSISEMKTKKIKCVSRPYIYRIDPNSLCNLQCVSCNTYSEKTDEKRIMYYNDYSIILKKLKKYALRFSLYDMGEPLMHKEIYKMISDASNNKISTLISTNFNLFKKEDVEKLFKSRLTKLEPCLDGFTQENYKKYRQKGDVEKVKNGITAVMDYKLKNKSKYPVVDVQVIEFDHIKKELPLIDKFLKEIKVDKITYRAESLGFNSEKTTLKREGNEGNSCFWLYLGMMIRPDGQVYPCCGRGFNRFSYGNILKQDLSEIWNNKYYQFSRSLFVKGAALNCDKEMADIPCLKCKEFKIQRKVNII